MNKNFIPAFFMLCSVNIFGVTLDELVTELDSAGYSRGFRELEVRSLTIEEKKTDLIDRDGIDINGDSVYLDDNRGSEFDSNLSAKYDFFKYQASYDHKDDGLDRELLGVEKNLKDIFYSERSYRKNLFGYDRTYRLNQEDARFERDVIDLISLYKDYMDSALELKLREQLLPGLISEYKTIKKQYEVGVGTEVDYRYSEVRLKNAENDISQLEDDLVKLRGDFYEVFKIDIGSRELKKSGITFSESNLHLIGERDLDDIDLLTRQAKENYTYTKYDDRWPDINAGTFWDTVSDGWVLSLEVNKKLFEYNDTSELYLVEVERLDVEYEKKKNEVSSLRRDYENRYNSLSREKDNLTRQQEVDEMKYSIYKLMFEQGSKSYIDYVEKYDEYVETSIALDKKSNELDALLYEIKYKN